MTAKQTPYLNTRQDANCRFLGLPTLVRSTAESTNGGFGLIEHWDMPVGFASPYHTHHHEDESFYVLEGTIAFVCDGNWLRAGKGAFVYGPREVPHGFRVIGDAPASLLLLCNPAGFERFVLEQATPAGAPPAPPDQTQLLTLATKYGIAIHGPLPDMPKTLDHPAVPTQDLKHWNHRWLQAFNDRDWNTEAALRHSGFRAYLSGAREPLDSNAWSGFLLSFTQAFPDANISIDSCITERDSVVTRWTLTATHHGAFEGIPPTGLPVRFSGIEFNRIVEDRIVEHWSMFDNVALLRQIGAMPA